jgi:hypothetical protein
MSRPFHNTPYFCEFLSVGADSSDIKIHCRALQESTRQHIHSVTSDTHAADTPGGTLRPPVHKPVRQNGAVIFKTLGNGAKFAYASTNDKTIEGFQFDTKFKNQPIPAQKRFDADTVGLFRYRQTDAAKKQRRLERMRRNRRLRPRSSPANNRRRRDRLPAPPRATQDELNRRGFMSVDANAFDLELHPTKSDVLFTASNGNCPQGFVSAGNKHAGQKAGRPGFRRFKCVKTRSVDVDQFRQHTHDDDDAFDDDDDSDDGSVTEDEADDNDSADFNSDSSDDGFDSELEKLVNF